MIPYYRVTSVLVLIWSIQMIIRALAVFCFLTAWSNMTAASMAGIPSPVSSGTTAGEPRTMRVEETLRETDEALELAADGQYGPISDRDFLKLEEARATIASLVSTDARPARLDAAQQVILRNAQEQISAILRDDEKDRRVCKRIAITGTRLGKTECLSVAERETRAKAAKTATADAQRGFCIGSEASRCVK